MVSTLAGDGRALVTLTLVDREFHLVKDYEIQTSVFTQPSNFNIDLGDAADVSAMLATCPPHTPFSLAVNGITQFEGHTDAIGDRGDANSSTIKFRGRDILSPLHDGMVEDEQSLEDKSPLEILKIALDAVGMDAEVLVNNDASRKARSGKAIVTLNAKDRGEARPRRKRRAAKCGETWYQVLLRELQHAGLFLWAAPGNRIVISAPDPDQTQIAVVYRNAQGLDVVQGPTTWLGNIQSHDFELDTTHRFSRCRVFGRGGGQQFGNTLASGVFEDPEMIAWGFKRTKTVKDVNVNSNEEAAFFARRKIAESRRQGFRLSYVVEGHTFEALDGSGAGVWTPDTMIQVEDDHLGIHGPHWLEGVVFRGSEQGTTTTLRLLRPSDLVFGSDEEIDGGGGGGSPNAPPPDPNLPNVVNFITAGGFISGL